MVRWCASILSKVFKRHVDTLPNHQALTHLLEWGFLARRSTTLALLSEWMQSLDSGIAVFFDFKKAFGSVPHRKLISKLKSLQLNPAVIRWICNYLSIESGKYSWRGHLPINSSYQGSTMFSLGTSSVFSVYIIIQSVTPSTFPWSKDGTLRRWCVVIREYSLPTLCRMTWI